MPKFYYAVRVGRRPGVYKTWDECQSNVSGYSGAQFHKFRTEEDARRWMSDGPPSVSHHDLLKVSYDNAEDMLIDGDDESLDGHCYVDGSYDKLTQRYAYGVALFHKGKQYDRSGAIGPDQAPPGMSSMWNVAGELTAAVVAAKLARELRMARLTVHHDYEGIEAWYTGRWRTKYDAVRRCIDEIRETGVELQFVKVTAHTGVRWNEYVDRLAKGALGIG